MIGDVSGGKERQMQGFCFSIDVERDYRLDREFSTRGISEGLPGFLDLLRSHRIPFDLFFSGEIVPRVPRELVEGRAVEVSVGCHGLTHPPGFRSYLNRRTATAQAQDISKASKLIERHFGRRPMHFRAPNFSADHRTLAILAQQQYRVDSSVLPGRFVRRLRVLSVVDMRDAPIGPYHPSRSSITEIGDSPIVEVPVTANPVEPGSPLGLGFLNDAGPEAVVRAARAALGPYTVFLCHSWEMVDWASADRVAPWVRAASSSNLGSVETLVSLLDGLIEFTNMDSILRSEEWSSSPLRAGSD